MYPRWIYPPATAAQIQKVVGMYSVHWFPGCICRCGLCTYSVGLLSGNAQLTVLQWQSNYLLWGVRVTQWLHHQCHSWTSRNAQLQEYDKFVMDVRNGLYKDVTFQLYDRCWTVWTERNCWLMVDGGYHKWHKLMCPLEDTSVGEELE
jgi:hypothetical protein